MIVVVDRAADLVVAGPAVDQVVDLVVADLDKVLVAVEEI
jgi:hypothetical protein